MLRIGIIGCGKIADAHAFQIARLPHARLVAACDAERLMAEQLCERFNVGAAFSSVAEMLANARLDVVHITTPPQSHFSLAQQCLEGGCHVYVEKPFTLNTADASALLATAHAAGRRITVGHDDQFTHVARRMRTLIRTGYLGGPPVHMESYYGYELGDSYARALLNDSNHWVRRLPGGLPHNIISHGIARVAEFIASDEPRVVAEGFASPHLQSLGEAALLDELRVMIFDENRCTAYFTFSTQMRPCLHQFRVYGPKNGLMLDHDKEVLLKLRGEAYKSYAEKFVPPITLAGQYLRNFGFNLGKFVGRDFHLKSGMKHLIERFYAAIEQQQADPIPEREILLVSRIMDSIFSQVGASSVRVNDRHNATHP